MPIYFQTASGNVTADQTHQATWQLRAELDGRKDFVYVADGNPVVPRRAPLHSPDNATSVKLLRAAGAIHAEALYFE